MALRTRARGLFKSRTREEARELFRLAFVQAIEASSASINAAARWLRIRPETVRGWLSGEHRMDVEVVATSPKLWPHFLRCLVVLERKARVI